VEPGLNDGCCCARTLWFPQYVWRDEELLPKSASNSDIAVVHGFDYGDLRAVKRQALQEHQ